MKQNAQFERQVNLQVHHKGVNGSWITTVLFAIVLASLTGCTQENDSSADDGPPPSRAWKMVWNDEFNGDTLDLTKWEIQIGDGLSEGIPNGWGNNELQYYTENNLMVDGGNLVITARADNPVPDPAFGNDSNYTYSSARIRTQGKFDFTYGRIEARIKTPGIQGLWPAFWLLGSEEGPYGGWAAKGEIDIMESYKIGVDDLGDPGDPDDDIIYEPEVSGAAHFGGPFPFNKFTSKQYITAPAFDPADDFHVYAVEWDATSIRWFIDGVNYFSLRDENYWNYYYSGEEFGFLPGGAAAPFDAVQHIILNMAVGGNLPLRNPNPEPPIEGEFPAEMLVDYVRVYTCPFNEDTGDGCKNQIDQTEEFLAFEFDEDNGAFQFDALYANGPIVLPSGRELALFENDPGNVLIVEEIQEPLDDGGSVTILQLTSSGSGGQVSLRDAVSDPFILAGLGDSGNDYLSLADFKFTIYVDSALTDANAMLRLFMATAAGRSWLDIPLADFVQDDWQIRSFNISDILNTDPATSTGDPIDTSEIVDWFGFELLGNASIRIGELYFACGGPFACGLVDGFDVYIDSVADIWDRDIQAFDTTVGGDYDTRIGNHVQWREYDTGDPAHNTVIETRFGSTGASGVTFIGATEGQDLSGLIAGELSFDIRVTSNPNNVDLFFKVEQGPGEGSGEIPMGDTPLNTWVTKCARMAFLETAGAQLNSITAPLVLVPGAGGSGQDVIVEWDNIRFVPEATCPGITPPINFEDTNILYPIGNFEAAVTQIIDNPEQSGINTSSRVAQMVKNTPTDPTKVFGGSFLSLSEPIDFDNGSAFKVKVFANRVGMDIEFKFESTESAAQASEIITTTVANQWEEISIDFTGKESSDFNRLTIIIDPTIAGDGSADYTLLFDDIVQESSGLVPAELPITFDDPGLAYPLTDFDGAVTSVVTDPESINGNVASAFFPGPALRSPIAGTIVGGANGFANSIPFVGSDIVISMDVYSPRPNVKVQLKIENAQNAFTSAFDEQFTTTSGQWETLTFTIQNLVATDTFEKLIIFLDQGASFTLENETWYWDNLQIVTP